MLSVRRMCSRQQISWCLILIVSGLDERNYFETKSRIVYSTQSFPSQFAHILFKLLQRIPVVRDEEGAFLIIMLGKWPAWFYTNGVGIFLSVDCRNASVHLKKPLI